MIADAVARLRGEHGLPVDPDRRGPVPLNRFFEECTVRHVAIPGLTLGAVAAHLRADGVDADDLGDPATTLAGFLFASGRTGLAFMDAADILPRRRFTAAHELGHAVLHRGRMSRFLDAAISETDDTTAEIEREANRFAAELLMPEAVVRARADELRREYRACPRPVLAHRLASELLVSVQAARYRLKSLGVGDDD